MRFSLKLIWRSWRKQPFIAMIMILGMSLAFSASWLIFHYLFFQTGFDTHFPQHQNLYFVGEKHSGVEDTWYYTRAKLWPAIQATMPEVENGTRIVDNLVLDFTHEAQRFREVGMFVDSNYLHILNISPLQGQLMGSLSRPHSILLTESLASKYFPNSPALGQTIQVNYKDFQVTGVIPDFPQQSSFSGDFLLSHSYRDSIYANLTNWYATSTPTLLKLNPSASPDAVGEKITELVRQHVTEEGPGVEFSLLPIRKYYLQNPEFRKQLRLMGIIVLALLIIAGINISNLITAGSFSRLKGIGVQKSLGITRMRIRKQIMNEALVLTLLGSLLGFILADIGFPYFNSLMQLPSLNEAPIAFSQYGLMVVISLMMGVLAGWYPSWKLPKIPVPNALKGKVPRDPKGEVFQNSLVTIQFGLSVMFIIGALFVNQQLEFMKQKELNINPHNVISVRIDPDEFETPNRITQFLPQFKNQLTQNPYIQTVSSSMFVPYHEWMWGNMVKSDGGKDFHTQWGIVDQDFPDVFGLELKNGHLFSDSTVAGIPFPMLVNERFVNAMEWTNPLGETVPFLGATYQVIGVVKDFHYTSVEQPIQPLIYLLGEEPIQPWWHKFLSLKYSGHETEAVLGYLESQLREMDPSFPFETFFVDEAYASQYEWIQQRSSLISTLSALAIAVALMGLFGLMAFMTFQRTKEIGIRKVMGASLRQLLVHFTRRFTRPLLLGCLGAIPFAYWVVDHWLEDFAYRIPLTIQNFVLGIAIALTLAMLIILQHVYRVAVIHPVEALRDE